MGGPTLGPATAQNVDAAVHVLAPVGPPLGPGRVAPFRPAPVLDAAVPDVAGLDAPRPGDAKETPRAVTGPLLVALVVEGAEVGVVVHGVRVPRAPVGARAGLASGLA